MIGQEGGRKSSFGAQEHGYFQADDPQGKAGDRYTYTVDGQTGVSRFCLALSAGGGFWAFGSGRSADFSVGGSLLDPAPKWNGQIVYELHVGTFTSEGTFRAAIERLPHLLSLGVTCVEIMPVAQCTGRRNWGYDGTMLFAPSASYGHPDDFRALIDACHLNGLAVMLDVVFNHLGSEGNFSGSFSPHYFHSDQETGWGQNFNLDGSDSAPVRALLQQNLDYWMDEFRIDGFRMDATHAILDRSQDHILQGLADRVHQQGGFIIAEDDRNDAQVLFERWNFNAGWADDFHHSLRVSHTGESMSYLGSYAGSIPEMVDLLEHGWLFRGQEYPFTGRRRGTPSQHLPPEAFVCCISNHDQVGNRPFGDRLNALISAQEYRALSLFFCLIPYTPMLFMGQEWAASTPFAFFCDFADELGPKIRRYRAEELRRAGLLGEGQEIPDPQMEESFLRSKLQWAELGQASHSGVLDLYRAGLGLRRKLFGPVNPPRRAWKVESTAHSVRIAYALHDLPTTVELRLRSAPRPSEDRVILHSNDPRFGGPGHQAGSETIVTGVHPS